VRTNVDPEVVKVRAKLGTAVREKDAELEDQYRQELHDLNIIVAARRVAARLPELSPEKREQVRALLAGA
jgi:hypothetical protein